MPDIKTFMERILALLDMEDKTLPATIVNHFGGNPSGNEIKAVSSGEIVVEGLTSNELDELKVVLDLASRVEMNTRLHKKIQRKGAYVSPLFGLTGRTEYVTRCVIEYFTGNVGSLPANYLPSNPVLWTEFGYHYYSDTPTPFGKVVKAGETVAEVAAYYDWDVSLTKWANSGRGIPLSSRLQSDAIIFPPFHKEPKAQFFVPGSEHFLALFNEKKSRKYSSSVLTAPVFDSQELKLALWSHCRWVPVDSVGCYDEDEWKVVHEHSGKALLAYNVDGTHYMNKAASVAFDSKRVQFRTTERKMMDRIKDSINDHGENFTTAHEANTTAMVLKGIANNPDSDYYAESVSNLSEEYEALINDVLDFPEAYSGWSDAVLCGRHVYNAETEESEHIPGVLEVAFGLLSKPETVVSDEGFLVKGVADLPHFDEATFKLGGDAPTLIAWAFEVKGTMASYFESIVIETALKSFDNEGIFDVSIVTDTTVDTNVIGYPEPSIGSFGYQQMGCIGSAWSMSPEDNRFVLEALEQFKSWSIPGFDFAECHDRQTWIDQLVLLQHETLFGAFTSWEEGVLKRLKFDPLNAALLSAMGDIWVSTEAGSAAYRETAEKMAELLFKGAGMSSLYLHMTPPSLHKAEKLKQKGCANGYMPIPHFWEGHGHGKIVDSLSSRNPVVTMDNPAYGKVCISKFVDAHVAPQALVFGPLVGDFDGDTSSNLVFTPKSIFDKLKKRKNKIVALCHNLVITMASRDRADRLAFDVENVPADKNFTALPTSSNGEFLWDNLNLEANQGQMGISAFGFEYGLAFGKIGVNTIELQTLYQNAIDLQGKINVNPWGLHAGDIRVGDKVSISPDGWEKAQRVNLNAIAKALVKDPSRKWDLNNPHWEIVVPPFLKAELQDWARNRSFGKGNFFEAETSVGVFKINRDIVLGYRKSFINSITGREVIMTGDGLREINPASVSLLVYNKYLKLKLGVGKGQSIRDLAWINPDREFFSPSDNLRIGKHSLNHHIWNAVVALCEKSKGMPTPEYFWCPKEEVTQEEESIALAALEEVFLDTVKIGAYTSFLSKEVCKVLSKDFLSFIPFFQWNEHKDLLVHLFGYFSNEEDTEDIGDEVQDPAFWQTQSVGLEDGLFCPDWMEKAYEDVEGWSHDPLRYEEEHEALKERVNRSWTKAISTVQKLYEMIVMNASNDHCSIHEKIIPKFKTAGSSNELYYALVKAHNTPTCEKVDDDENHKKTKQKGLRCPSCYKAFLANSTPQVEDESRQIFTEVHKLLVKVDKYIDRLQLGKNSPKSLVELQKLRKRRYDESRGIGEKGFGLSRRVKTRPDYYSLLNADKLGTETTVHEKIDRNKK